MEAGFRIQDHMGTDTLGGLLHQPEPLLILGVQSGFFSGRRSELELEYGFYLPKEREGCQEPAESDC